MTGPPGPDDPRYWERLAKGPPLDEWREVGTPEWHERIRREARREQLHFRVFCWVVGILVAALFLWGVLTQPGADTPAGYDDIELDCEYDRPWAGGC